MGKIVDSPLTDEELAARGIEIPETETEEGFFQWINDMIEDEFKDVKK